MKSLAIVLGLALTALASGAIAQQADATRPYNPDQDAYAIVQASQRIMLYLHGQEQSWQQQLNALRQQNDELQKEIAKLKAKAAPEPPK